MLRISILEMHCDVCIVQVTNHCLIKSPEEVVWGGSSSEPKYAKSRSANQLQVDALPRDTTRDRVSHQYSLKLASKIVRVPSSNPTVREGHKHRVPTPKNLRKSRGPLQNPAERPRRTLRGTPAEPSERPPQSPLRGKFPRRASQRKFAPLMVTLRNLRKFRKTPRCP